MPSVLHNPSPHLCYDPIPVAQSSLIDIIGFFTWNISLAPPSPARLSYTLDPAPFAFQRFWYLLRILDPFRKRHNLASFSIRSFDNADRRKLECFCIGVPCEGCESGSGAVRVEGFDQWIRGQSGPLDGGEVGDVLWESYSYFIGGFGWYRGHVGNCWSNCLGHSRIWSRLSRRAHGKPASHDERSR